ncbi:MAG: protein-disulfide reductase DsbD domain-containing protein [Planctomycetota bacterium]
MLPLSTINLIAVVLLATSSLARGAEPKTKVSLHPAVMGIAPGATFDVAIQFELQDGWHIYWKNPGDAGTPPRVEWKLPPGFEVGELRFPVPKRHRDPGNLLTNVFEGEPILLQTLTAPKDLKPGDQITLAADLQWLSCKEARVPERESVSVTLPVGGLTTDLDPTHDAILQRGRRALPIAAEASKYVKVAPSVAVQTVKPGQAFEVVLEVAIAKGNHLQSNQPPQAAFIPTHVFLERDPGLDLGKIVYPPPEERIHPQLGKVSEYRGKVQIRIPVQVREDAEGARVRMAGVVTTQACSDKSGTCYPPENIAWGLEVPLDRSGVAALSPESQVPGSESPQTPAGGIQTEVPAQAEAELDEASTDDDQLQRFLARRRLPGLLLGCFLYGLFINATPCVLPLLSIKVLGFVQQAHESRRRTLMLGLAFGAGVVLFFVALGFLAAAGKNLLQYPAVVIGLSAVVLALALSMLGVYTLQVPTAATKLEGSLQQEGVLASFGKGALAPVLGFACTGPLLAGAFGWATQQPPRTAVFAFLVTGLGMASPYMLLGANPNWLSFLPRPGPWMVTFERIMGFLLLAMVIWLLNPLVTQIGAAGLQWTLGFLVVAAMGCWLLGKIDINMSAARRWWYRGGAITLVIGAGLLTYGWIYPLDEARAEQQALRSTAHTSGDEWASGIPWQEWSPEAVEAAVRSGKTAFVDFTAAYCTVCKANKAVAINTPEARQKMKALGVVPFKADFTSGDPRIFEVLQQHGRAGVPLDLIYPAGKPDAPIVLRTNLTKRYLVQKLDEAGPSSNALASGRSS